MLSELLLRSALDHVARGWPVFPLRPGDKRPAIRDWEGRATTDPDRIRRAWTAAPYNVGVACGRAALVVVDLGTPKPGTDVPARWRQPGIVDGAKVLAALADDAGARLPIQTYTVRTASGGQHRRSARPAHRRPRRRRLRRRASDQRSTAAATPRFSTCRSRRSHRGLPGC